MLPNGSRSMTFHRLLFAPHKLSYLVLCRSGLLRSVPDGDSLTVFEYLKEATHDRKTTLRPGTHGCGYRRIDRTCLADNCASCLENKCRWLERSRCEPSG